MDNEIAPIIKSAPLSRGYRMEEGMKKLTEAQVQVLNLLKSQPDQSFDYYQIMKETTGNGRTLQALMDLGLIKEHYDQLSGKSWSFVVTAAE